MAVNVDEVQISHDIFKSRDVTNFLTNHVARIPVAATNENRFLKFHNLLIGLLRYAPQITLHNRESCCHIPVSNYKLL